MPMTIWVQKEVVFCGQRKHLVQAVMHEKAAD
jgi:hypothetical protein